MATISICNQSVNQPNNEIQNNLNKTITFPFTFEQQNTQKEENNFYLQETPILTCVKSPAPLNLDNSLTESTSTESTRLSLSTTRRQTYDSTEYLAETLQMLLSNVELAQRSTSFNGKLSDETESQYEKREEEERNSENGEKYNYISQMKRNEKVNLSQVTQQKKDFDCIKDDFLPIHKFPEESSQESLIERNNSFDFKANQIGENHQNSNRIFPCCTFISPQQNSLNISGLNEKEQTFQNSLEENNEKQQQQEEQKQQQQQKQQLTQQGEYASDILLIDRSVLERIQEIDIQEDQDESESPTLRLNIVRSHFKDSIEDRIFRWLDEQGVVQVDPSSKRENYYHNKRTSVIQKQDIISDDKISTNSIPSLKLCKITSSPLFNRRKQEVNNKKNSNFQTQNIITSEIQEEDQQSQQYDQGSPKAKIIISKGQSECLIQKHNHTNEALQEDESKEQGSIDNLKLNTEPQLYSNSKISSCSMKQPSIKIINIDFNIKRSSNKIHSADNFTQSSQNALEEFHNNFEEDEDDDDENNSKNNNTYSHKISSFKISS